jgi:hypothetical protein
MVNNTTLDDRHSAVATQSATGCLVHLRLDHTLPPPPLPPTTCRTVLRSAYGVANTLRKMRRGQEAYEAWQLLFKYSDRW